MGQIYRLFILLLCLGPVSLLSGQDAEVVRLQEALATAEGHDRVTNLNELSAGIMVISSEHVVGAIKVAKKYASCQ